MESSKITLKSAAKAVFSSFSACLAQELPHFHGVLIGVTFEQDQTGNLFAWDGVKILGSVCFHAGSWTALCGPKDSLANVTRTEALGWLVSKLAPVGGAK